MSEINQLYYTISNKPDQLDRILHLVSLYLEELGSHITLSLRDVRISNPRVITDDPYLDTEIDFRIIRSTYKGPKFTIIRFKRDALDHTLVKVRHMGNNVYEILPIDYGFDDIENKDYTSVFIDYLSKDPSLVLNAVNSVVYKDGKYQITFKDETVFNSDKFVVTQAKKVEDTNEVEIDKEMPLNPPVSDHEAIIEDEEHTPTTDDKESITEPSREDLDNTTVDQTVETTIETPDESLIDTVVESPVEEKPSTENTDIQDNEVSASEGTDTQEQSTDSATEDTNTPDTPVEDNTVTEEIPVENNSVENTDLLKENELQVTPREEKTQENPVIEEPHQEDTASNQPDIPVKPKPKLYFTSRVYKLHGEDQYRQEIVVHGEEDPAPMFDKGYAILCSGYILKGDVTTEMHEKAMSVIYEDNSVYVKHGDTDYEYLYIPQHLPVDLVYTFTKELTPS